VKFVAVKESDGRGEGTRAEKRSRFGGEEEKKEGGFPPKFKTDLGIRGRAPPEVRQCVSTVGLCIREISQGGQ